MTKMCATLIILLLAVLWTSSSSTGNGNAAAVFAGRRSSSVQIIHGDVQWCNPSSRCSTSEQSLNVEIDNNMENPESGGFIVGCVAYTAGNGEVPEDLGGAEDPPVQPMHFVEYYMNLEFLVPTQIACTFDWPASDQAGNKTVTLYDAHNVELQSLNIRWGVDERGFSLYDPITEAFELYETW